MQIVQLLLFHQLNKPKLVSPTLQANFPKEEETLCLSETL